MSNTWKNVLAVILGIVVGMVVNMGLIKISGSVIPLPEGVDPNDMESLKKNMHLFPPKNFVFPFLAHALGTFAGAAVAVAIAATHKFRFALFFGFFFLLGGAAAAYMLPAPMWFEAVDLTLAYIPMSLLAYALVNAFSKK